MAGIKSMTLVWSSDSHCSQAYVSACLSGFNTTKIIFTQVHNTIIHKKLYILYEYRDLFIDMDVRNNRSELAIANRHQER